MSCIIYSLNVNLSPFVRRKVREVTRSVREFFSKSCELKYVGLSGTKLPPQALRCVYSHPFLNYQIYFYPIFVPFSTYTGL